MHAWKDGDDYKACYITGPTSLCLAITFGDDSAPPVVKMASSDKDPDPSRHDPDHYLKFAKEGLLRANQEANGNLSIKSIEFSPSESPSVAGFADVIVYRIASRVLAGGEFPFRT